MEPSEPSTLRRWTKLVLQPAKLGDGLCTEPLSNDGIRLDTETILGDTVPLARFTSEVR